MAYRIRILTPDEAWRFVGMTFPAFRRRLGRGTLGAGLYVDGRPAGLALAGSASDGVGAELLSLFVERSFRSRGMGRALLSHAERALRTAAISSVRAVWSDTLPRASAFKAVLARSGWDEPHKRMIVLRGDMAGDFGREVREKYSKYQSADCVPRKYTLLSWGDMSAQDREFILSREGRPGWFASRANPFREEAILESANSLMLRREGEVVGWLTVHRTAPDTLRYTDVFIREDLKRAGAVSIAMVTHGFWLQLAEGTPRLTMATEVENEPLVQFYHNRMTCSQLSWTWGANKKLS